MNEKKKDKPTLKALQLKRDLYQARKKAEENAIAARKVRSSKERVLN